MSKPGDTTNTTPLRLAGKALVGLAAVATIVGVVFTVIRELRPEPSAEDVELVVEFLERPNSLSRSDPVFTVEIEVLNDSSVATTSVGAGVTVTDSSDNPIGAWPSHESRGILKGGESLTFSVTLSLEAHPDIIDYDSGFWIHASAGAENAYFAQGQEYWVRLVPACEPGPQTPPGGELEITREACG